MTSLSAAFRIVLCSCNAIGKVGEKGTVIVKLMNVTMGILVPEQVGM